MAAALFSRIDETLHFQVDTGFATDYCISFFFLSFSNLTVKENTQTKPPPEEEHFNYTGEQRLQVQLIKYVLESTP